MKKLETGDVIRLESGEHAAVLIYTSDLMGHEFVECLTGNGEVVSVREKDIREENRTPYKVNIDVILGTLKVYDRRSK